MVNFSFCAELGSTEPSHSNLIDLPPKMTNFVLLGPAEPTILSYSTLHGVQRVAVLPSSRQWWSGLFIIGVIHGCFMLFLLSWALQSPGSRNSRFQALLLPVWLYIVVLVYNPVLLPLFLVNFMFLGSAEPNLLEMPLCTLLSYRCCSLL